MKPRSWVQDMKSGFAAASTGPAIKLDGGGKGADLPGREGTSVGEAVLLQRAVDVAVQKALEIVLPAALRMQRERIAAGIEHAARTHLQDYDATLFDIAADVRSGEIGGWQK